ncbi:MAG TPA: TRAP transporter small permease subunit [Burkholderiales bacterium]|nr:TRAP transporter small permease subunit [Burkholderiales bacterium]
MRAFFRAYDAVIDGLAWACGAALAAVTAMVIVAVVLRSTRLGEPDWILPTTEYAMLFIGTLGAPWLLRERGHVVIDVVRVSVSPRVRRVMGLIVALASFALCALLVYFSFPVVRATWGEYEMRAYMMPKALLVIPVGISFALLAIGFLRALTGYSHLYEDEGRARTGEL